MPESATERSPARRGGAEGEGSPRVAAAEPSPTRTRGAAADRRDQVLDAAIAEFAEHGFHGASTPAIARRAGISQPYIYALFPNKKAVFLAAHTRVVDRIRDGFATAAEGAHDPGDALRRAGSSFLAADREALLCQLQGYAASGDPELREHVRGEFVRLFDEVRAITGASRDEVALFIAGGMFLTVAGALDVPRAYWPKPPYGGS
jgi:AcrR family transcriptional regulator